MITMKHEIGTTVDIRVDAHRIPTPVNEMLRRIGNVAQAGGTEVIDNEICIGAGRPECARRTIIDRILAHGHLSQDVLLEAIDNLAAKSEPRLWLPCAGDDGMIVEGGVLIRFTFIF